MESKFFKIQHTTNLQFKWDMRFNEMAELVSKWSKDPSTKCGAVVVRPDRTVCSVGYNGFPRGMQDTEERLNNREDKYSRVVHCEVNAVLSAREPIHGHTLYTWPFLTCDRCTVIMIQAGIKRVVAPILPDDKIERWGKSFELSKDYYEEAGIEVFEI